jgi:cupin 2 domain-containing protein
MQNLFRDIPDPTGDEQVDTLLAQPGLRIERIVSTGQASPPGFWYDQPQDEWVAVLRGAAGVVVEGEVERRLDPGDVLFLPARTRHRVAWTAPDEPTVWLAVHFGGGVES